MKKLRKHFMILFLFLLFGTAVLSLSSNGVFASAFGWLQSSPTGSSGSSADSASSSVVSPQDADSVSEDAVELFPAQIGAAGQPLENENINDISADHDTSDDNDPPIISTSALGTTVVRSSDRPSSVGPVKIAQTDQGSTSSSPSSGSAPVNQTPTGTGGTPSDTGRPTPSGTDPSGGNTTPVGTGSSGNHSGGGHHSRSVSITGVTLDKTALDLTKGESAVLTGAVAPANTTQDKTITWSSSDPAVATVDDTGKASAIEGGAATITATTSNGKTATCSVTVSVPATGISLSLSDTPVERGQTLKLTSKLTPADSTEKVLWATSDSNIATVDSSGNVTGVSPGTAVIIAAVGDGSISASCRITTIVSISKLVLSDEDLTVKKGEGHQLTAQVLPEDTTEDTTVTWSSSDPDVATVDDSGKVTAIEGGTAIITAQTGTHSAQCAVTVLVPVTGIALDRTELTLVRGTTETLSPIIAPADATDKTVDWTSSDETVATVDESGEITAVSAGTAMITATTHDGGFSAQCTVTVIVPVTGISLDQSELNLKKGNTAALTATIAPADATDQAVNWTSSDPDVAAVDSTGQVTATGGGTATVTVTTHDGGFTASCNVTVTVPVTGISLNKTSLTLLNGASETLTPIFEPADATDQAVTWSSSDGSIATVDDNGIVVAVSTGKTAVITATTHDGGYTANCMVSTAIPVTGISLNKTSLTINQGHTDTLTATITPSNATNKTVTWSSSNTSVLTVSSSGVITTREYGTATITAKTQDGGFTATCQVTVNAAVQAKVDPGNSHWAGTINSNGSGEILVRDRNEDSYTNVYSYIDFYFADPVTYQATNLTDFEYGDASPQSIMSFSNSTYYEGAWGVDTSLSLSADGQEIGRLNSTSSGDYPWFSWVSDDGLMITRSGQATHFRLEIYARLKATDVNDNDDEAYVTWSKITLCGIPLTDIQVLS